MSKPGRFELVSLIPKLLIGAQIMAVAFGFDVWPISTYPMFSGSQKIQEMRQHRFEAVLADHSTVPLTKKFTKLNQRIFNSAAGKSSDEINKLLIKFYFVFVKENPAVAFKVDALQLVQRRFPNTIEKPREIETSVLHKITKEEIQELASR